MKFWSMCVVEEQGDVLQGGGVQLRSLHLSHCKMAHRPHSVIEPELWTRNPATWLRRRRWVSQCP